MHPPPPPLSLPPKCINGDAPSISPSTPSLSDPQSALRVASSPSSSLDARRHREPLSSWFIPSPVFASPTLSQRPDEYAVEFTETLGDSREDGYKQQEDDDGGQNPVARRCYSHEQRLDGADDEDGAAGGGLGISLPSSRGRNPKGDASKHCAALGVDASNPRDIHSPPTLPLSVPSTPSPIQSSNSSHQGHNYGRGHSHEPAPAAIPPTDSASAPPCDPVSLSARYRRGYSVSLFSPALVGSSPPPPSAPIAPVPLPLSSKAVATVAKVCHSPSLSGKRGGTFKSRMGSIARSALFKKTRRRILCYLLLGIAVWALGSLALRAPAPPWDPVLAKVPAGRLSRTEWEPAAPQHENQGSDAANVGAKVGADESGKDDDEGRARAVPERASNKLKVALQKEAARRTRTAAEKRKKLAALMPLEGVSRRFRYGANFQPTADEQSGKNWESTNSKLKKTLDPKKLHELGRQHYLASRGAWTSYTWQPPSGGESTGPGGVHESLVPWIRGLEPWEVDVREAVWKLREWAGQGQSVGLATAGEPSFDREPPFRAALTDAPDASLAKLANFSVGPMVKWSELLQEEDALLRGGSTAAHACGPGPSSSWMRKYAEMHQAASSGKVPGRFLTYICETGSNCGGLGDRLLGMTSGFLFALATGRAFHAEWQSPVPVDAIFDAPHFDWSFSSFEERPAFRRPELAGKARELDVIHFDAESTDKVFGTRDWNAPLPNGGDSGKSSTRELTKGLEARDLAFASPWIKFFTNRGLVYRSFRYKRMRSRLTALGLRPRSAFGCVFNYLFTPKQPARDFINAYGTLFSLPSVFSVGVQIRTGDMSMKDPEYDKLNTVDRHSDFFRCADELAETYAFPGQKVVYYLVTDSQHLREDARRKLGAKVVVSGLGIQHVHQKSGHADGVHNAVVEEWILAKTDYRVITQDSGFGKLASFAAGKLGATVTIFPQSNPDVLALKGKKARTNVDCRLESAFVTFDQLASEWSLG